MHMYNNNLQCPAIKKFYTCYYFSSFLSWSNVGANMCPCVKYNYSLKVRNPSLFLFMVGL